MDWQCQSSQLIFLNLFKISNFKLLKPRKFFVAFLKLILEQFTNDLHRLQLNNMIVSKFISIYKKIYNKKRILNLKF